MKDMSEGLARVGRLVDRKKLAEANALLTVVMLMGCTEKVAIDVLGRERLAPLVEYRGVSA